MEIFYFHPNLKIKTKNIPHLTNSWFACKIQNVCICLFTAEWYEILLI